jgi:hypothetical protein
MGLHARAVAVAAGALGDQVERVAALIVEARDITLEGARAALLVVAAEGSAASKAMSWQPLRLERDQAE